MTFDATPCFIEPVMRSLGVAFTKKVEILISGQNKIGRRRKLDKTMYTLISDPCHDTFALRPRSLTKQIVGYMYVQLRTDFCVECVL